MTTVVLFVLAVMTLGRRVAPIVDRLRRRMARHRPVQDEGILVADLTALGLSAGLSFPAALTAAAKHASDDTSRLLRRRLRAGDQPGNAGDSIEELFALAERAHVTGAPLLASIDGHTQGLRREARAGAVERARRLPVKLLFPLALLILPGFLLLTVAPAFLAGIDRLGL